MHCLAFTQGHILLTARLTAKQYNKPTFSVYKLITKNAQMTTLYTNWSLGITFTMIYNIRQEHFCKMFLITI